MRLIRGLPTLPHSCRDAVVAVGTFLVAGAMTGGRVTVKKARADTMDAILVKLEEAGAHVNTTADTIEVDGRGRRPKAINLTTATEQIAQSEVSLNRIVVVFSQLQENFNSLVLLLIEQVVQATKVIRRQLTDACARAQHANPARRPPPEAKGHRHKCHQHIHEIHDVAVGFLSALCRA